MKTEIELLGITRHDIQEIFEKTIAQFKQKTRIIFLDASYFYTFHLDDFEIVRKFCILGRYDINAVLEWHNCLERWCNDQTVSLCERPIKPIQIERSLDRVVNEGLEAIAASIVAGSGGDDSGGTFPYRSIGDGTVPVVLPSDKTLANEVDRINVLTNKEGGSISRDGSTIYSVGNHSKSIPTPDGSGFTECGIQSNDKQSNDLMLDHSKFVTPIPHTQDADAPGSTTVIYMCSS